MGRFKFANPATLPISHIRCDPSVQARVSGIDQGVCEEYAAAMRNGVRFPGVKVFVDKDKGEYWLADGFHRIAAASNNGETYIDAWVEGSGGRREALLYACGANADHGLRRTNEDKRHAVETLLKDEEWRARGNQWIAEQCGVSFRMVYQVEDDLEATLQIAKLDRKIGADGKSRPTHYADHKVPDSAPYADGDLLPEAPIDEQVPAPLRTPELVDRSREQIERAVEDLGPLPDAPPEREYVERPATSTIDAVDRMMPVSDKALADQEYALGRLAAIRTALDDLLAREPAVQEFDPEGMADAVESFAAHIRAQLARLVDAYRVASQETKSIRRVK